MSVERIDEIRLAIEQLRQEAQSIRPNARPLEKATEHARAWIKQLASLFDKNALTAFARGTVPSPEHLFNAGLARPEQLIFIAFAALDGKRFEKFVAEQLAQLYADGEFQTGDASARLAEIDGEIFALEMEEEQAITQLARSGIALTRRSDADVRAILEVAAKSIDA